MTVKGVGGAGSLGGVTAISSGTDTVCAVSGGAGSCWGLGLNGRLGTGTTTDALSPAAVSGLSGAVDISAGYLNGCAALASGGVRCWGDNTNGQLGNGTATGSNVPVPVSGL